MGEQRGIIRSRLGLRGIVWLGTVIVTLLWVGWNGHPDDVATLLFAWFAGVATWALFSEWRLHRDSREKRIRSGVRKDHP